MKRTHRWAYSNGTDAYFCENDGCAREDRTGGSVSDDELCLGRLTEKQAAVLDALVRADTVETPNAIGQLMPERLVRVSPRHTSHNGKVMGAGSMIAPTLTSLKRAGFVQRARRPDGRSGTAYVVTDAGRRALACRR